MDEHAASLIVSLPNMPPSPVPAYVIRPAIASDASELARLFTELGHPMSAAGIRDHWAEWAGAANSAFVAAKGDGALLGVITLHRMLVLHRPKPVGRITALIVDPSARSGGIGRALVAAAEVALAGANCGLLEITSNLRLVDAHAFYERLGYRRTSIRLAKEL